ncbi:MAG: hypothetical protein AAF840_08695 [Bacteroidota bacterium]
MAKLSNLLQGCTKTKLAGMSGTAYIGLFPEIDVFPRTKAEIALAADPAAVIPAGDTKRLGEAVVYKTGGYHRQVQILVDTGNASNASEGEIGGQMNKGRFNLFLYGNEDEVREWLDCIMDNSGCMHIAAPSKDGQVHSYGTPDYPVWLESYEGGSGGDRVGYNVVLYTSFPRTNHSMNLTDFPLGLTPAA